MTKVTDIPFPAGGGAGPFVSKDYVKAAEAKIALIQKRAAELDNGEHDEDKAAGQVDAYLPSKQAPTERVEARVNNIGAATYSQSLITTERHGFTTTTKIHTERFEVLGDAANAAGKDVTVSVSDSTQKRFSMLFGLISSTS